jgi:succinoglycan biosynthesis transport protein ExoP
VSKEHKCILIYDQKSVIEMNDFIELRKVISLILRRWWLVLLLTLTAAGIGYGLSQRQERVYQATTSVMVGQSIQATQLDTRDIQTSERLALTYADITRRQPVLEAAIEALDLDISWEGLRKRVKVKLVPNTQLLEISVEASSRERAELIASELARQLVLLSPASLQDQGDDGTAHFVRQRLQELQTNIEASQSKLEELDEALASTRTDDEQAEIQAEIAALESKILDWENNYARFLAFVDAEESANYISVVDSAHAKVSSIRPTIRLNTIIAGAVGLALAMAIILLLDFLDDSVKTLDEISQELNLTPLGSIGTLGGNDFRKKMVVANDPFSPAAESYRMIRNNIEFATMGIAGKSILVASPGLADGKSSTVVNLGIAMARNGQRTTLVDSDMRRPMLHRIFDARNNGGLSNQLCRSNSATDVPLQTLDIEGLQLLTAGTIPPNPSELLNSERMEEILVTLMEGTDVIIFDSPPAALVADAAILSRYVDGVILVISAGKTRRKMAKQAVFNLQQAGANILGVVLNRASEKAGGYYKYAALVDEQTPAVKRIISRLKGIREGVPGTGPKSQDIRFCECGCGKPLPSSVTSRRRFINATHRMRHYRDQKRANASA